MTRQHLLTAATRR